MEGSPAHSEHFSLQFSLAVAQEKTESWLTEAAQMSATLGLHSPVLQCCVHILEEFRAYLPLLTKLGSLQLQSRNLQALSRGVFGCHQRGKLRVMQQLRYLLLLLEPPFLPGLLHDLSPSTVLPHPCTTMRVLPANLGWLRLGSTLDSALCSGP